MTWLLIGILLFCLFLMSLYIRIYTKVYFLHRSNTNYLFIEIRLLGIKIIKKEIPLETDTDDSSLIRKSKASQQQPEERNIQYYMNILKKYKGVARQIIDSRPILLKIMSKVKVHRFNWITKLGTGDASMTGVFSGGIWAIKGFFVGLIKQYMNPINQPMIEVIPVFQHKFADVELECMFSMRLGQTIYAIIQLTKFFSKPVSQIKKTVES